MSRNLRVAYLAHSIRSDWNNGNAHFLRGLLRALGSIGQEVNVFEPAEGWSYRNLLTEPLGARSLELFHSVYSDIKITTYSDTEHHDLDFWESSLRSTDIVILHEWNSTELAHLLLNLREPLGFRLLFHDTHHRASSSPEEIERFGIRQFDGVLAFGETLSSIYRRRFIIEKVWTFHEAADVSVFKPEFGQVKERDVVWVGNWGDDQRSREIAEYLLEPACHLRQYLFSICGVRYPEIALEALSQAGVQYFGYLPNLQAPLTYAQSRLTLHIPRQQYSDTMTGIPTIRVFEALASGIPLISAPWSDTEGLFCPRDFIEVSDTGQTENAIRFLLEHPDESEAQAERGLRTVLERHTCLHRAEQLKSIFEELSR